MYPSNIVSCISDLEVQNQVLENIHLLAPILSIHTNACDEHCMPEKIMLITNQEPTTVLSNLFHSTNCINQSKVEKELNFDQIIKLLMNCRQQHYEFSTDQTIFRK